MRPTLVILQREFLGYFRTPVAYVFLVTFLLLSVGLAFFVGDFFDARIASLERFFIFLPWLFALLGPAVTMRLWAEERRSGTLELLLTLPVTPAQAVAGKFLAAWMFTGLALALTFVLPLTVAYLGRPDWGMMVSGYVGSFLLAGACVGIGALMSALTRNQVIAFVLGVLVCLVLVLLGWSVFNNLLASALPVWAVDAIANFSFTTHFDSMTRGLIELRSVVFFLSLAFVSQLLTALAIER